MAGFEWDDAKSDETYRSRGLDFEFASHVFDGSFLEREDLRRDYGEARFVVIGVVDGRLITVVWTPRWSRRRIVAAWPSSNQERRMYREYFSKEA
jgi:uncharacterized DUF497 family protein